MISIRYSIPPPLISRYTSVISEATGFNYIAIRRHIVGFNPCFLEGRGYRCKTAKLISKPFQSTLPRRERPYQAAGVNINKRSFNPRSHEGSDQTCMSPCSPVPVSIHAPTKGATCLSRSAVSESRVSIHAPAKGATICRGYKWESRKFQSTLPRRERRNKVFEYGHYPDGFNPRSREGSDNFLHWNRCGA